MREVYLWYEDIPAANSLNYFQAPDAFLKSILSKNDKGFSTVDSIMDTPLPSYGFDYTLYKVATSDTTYTALVSYVAKNSPAEDAGWTYDTTPKTVCVVVTDRNSEGQYDGNLYIQNVTGSPVAVTNSYEPGSVTVGEGDGSEDCVG
jgi:hypothetical protein